MDFKALLENKPLLYGIIGGVVVVILAFFLMITIISTSGNSDGPKAVVEKVEKIDLDLLTTDNLGKAIEIQALLAREGITADRKADGSKSVIYLKAKTYTQSTRDRALLAIVKSGLMDQNIGLEIFDKGDFTSTKEDKKIRLARAINGELSRLIRKIPPIESASVFISIPEQSMFSSMQKPVTATVQLVIPSGEKLDNVKIRAITNLLLGSVSGLTSQNISITDTNGNVYNSIIDSSSEMLQKIEEQDKYMQQKVAAQLDRLVGKGNYVATVSTYLKQAPVEKFTIDYDPSRKAPVTEQTFTEGLGDQTQDINKNTNAVSVYLPNGLPANGTDSTQNRSYSRSARETQYGVKKTQINEYMSAGVLEEISVAVTLEKTAMPSDITIEELKELIANAASPKASAENVTIAFTESMDPFLAGDKAPNLPKPDETGNPWWIAIALTGLGLLILWRMVSDKIREAQIAQQNQVEALKEKSYEQDKQLRDVSLKAAELIEKQSELAQGLIEQQQREYVSMPGIDDALAGIRSEFETIDDSEAGEKIKSWIEQG